MKLIFCVHIGHKASHDGDFPDNLTEADELNEKPIPFLKSNNQLNQKSTSGHHHHHHAPITAERIVLLDGEDYRRDTLIEVPSSCGETLPPVVLTPHLYPSSGRAPSFSWSANSPPPPIEMLIPYEKFRLIQSCCMDSVMALCEDRSISHPSSDFKDEHVSAKSLRSATWKLVSATGYVTPEVRLDIMYVLV